MTIFKTSNIFTFTMGIEQFLLIGSLLLFMALVAGKTGYRFGVPALLLFLIVGMIAGNDGLGFINFQNTTVAQHIGVVALTCILFSGGMDTRYDEIKPIAGQGIVLATVGVLLTALITGLFIYYLTMFFFPSLTLTFLESMLLASVMSSTDSASVFAILRSKGLVLRHRLRPMLELESGSNDPMAYMLTISLIQLIQMQESSWGYVAWMFFVQLAIGVVAGYLLGRFAIWLLNKINIDNDSLYPVLLIACMFFIFSVTYFIKGNGFLAVYIGGLVIGNRRFVHKRTVKKFFDGLAWMFQIIMFLTLGLLVNPKELLPITGVGLLIGIFMIVFSRPLAVFASLLPFRMMAFKDRVYVSWVGLRGAVPIIFATYPLIANVPHARIMFNIVFFITIVSLLVQGTTVPTVAKWLGLTKPNIRVQKLKDFDVEFPEEIKSSMIEIAVTAKMLEHGHRLMDLPLPEKTLAVMAKRHHNYFVPKGNTEIKEDDKLLLISDDECSLDETYQKLGIEPPKF